MYEIYGNFKVRNLCTKFREILGKEFWEIFCTKFGDFFKLFFNTHKYIACMQPRFTIICNQRTTRLIKHDCGIIVEVIPIFYLSFVFKSNSMGVASSGARLSLSPLQ